MKLNNKGWGLQELIIGIAILFICLWLVSIMIQNSFGQLLGSSSSDKDSGVVENTNPDINIGNENTSEGLFRRLTTSTPTSLSL